MRILAIVSWCSAMLVETFEGWHVCGGGLDMDCLDEFDGWCSHVCWDYEGG